MIPASAAQQAILLAEQLEASNRRVVPAGDTPLAKLVSVSSVMFKPSLAGASGADMVEAMNAEYSPTAQQIEEDSRFASVEHGTLSQHDELMDSVVTDIAQVVGQHLTFAKNTVRPIVKQYVDEAAQALSAYPDVSTYSVNVNRVDLPEVALQPTVKSEAVKFKDHAYIPLNMAANLPPLAGASAASFMSTGSDAVDQALAIWVEQKGEQFFNLVYDVFFAASASGVSMTPEQMLSSKLDGLDVAAAAFLMARQLLDNVPEGAAYSLVDYRMAVGTIVEQTGLRLAKAYDDREAIIENEQLIISYSKDEVWVNAAVYDKWIAEGGNTALLFGNMLLDRPNLSLPAMAVDAEKAQLAWEQYNRFLNTTAANRRYQAAKDTLKFVTTKLVADNLQVCFGEVANDPGLSMDTPMVREAVQKSLDYIDSLDMDQIKDLWAIGTEVIAAQVFSYSCAADILRGIERAVKDNPEIDPGEAALMSTIEYVSNWVVDQIELRDL